MRCEKAASNRRVSTEVKAGESMISLVSSMRRRREAVVVGEVDCEEDVIPDSARTKSSWSGGGRRYLSHLQLLHYISRESIPVGGAAYRRSSSVAPSTRLRTSRVNSESLSIVISSRGL